MGLGMEMGLVVGDVFGRERVRGWRRVRGRRWVWGQVRGERRVGGKR